MYNEVDKDGNKINYSEIYRQAQVCMEYNQRLKYYSTAKKNERFLNGDQWEGVEAGDLPKPQANLFKKTIGFIVAWLTSSEITVKYQVKGIDTTKVIDGDMNDPDVLEIAKINKTVDLLNKKIKEHMEDNKFNHMIHRVLYDGAKSGDLSAISLWDMNVPSNDNIDGDFTTKRIKPARVLFGDPNTQEVNSNGMPVQPYIILQGRDTIENLKREKRRWLEKNTNLSKEKIKIEVDNVKSDKDNLLYSSSDRQEEELDPTMTSGDGKADYYIRLRYDHDKKIIMKQKAIKTCNITGEEETKYSIYPIAWGNWTIRDDSYRGQSPMTGYIQNQVFVNKALAIMMISLMNNASPKIAYDGNKINGISNSASGLIKVSGDVNNAIKTLTPGSISGAIMDVIRFVSQTTIESIGGNETILGNVNPVNKSAIVQVTEQSSIPFENQRKYLYDFVEQLAYIWYENLKKYYGDQEIMVTYEVDGQQIAEKFTLESILDKNVKVKVDVGASSYFSEMANEQMLAGLVESGLIDVIDYLERLDDNKIPQREELIEELKKRREGVQDEGIRADWEKVSAFVEQLPPEFQEQFARVMETE